MVQNVKTGGQIWRSRPQIQKGAQDPQVTKCGVHRSPDVGFIGKLPLKTTRMLWKAENWDGLHAQTGPSPSGRINQWLFGALLQSNVSVWLSPSTEQTLAACMSHLVSHQLKQAWPRLRLICLGQKRSSLPSLTVESRTLFPAPSPGIQQGCPKTCAHGQALPPWLLLERCGL